jgi:hypothetical protein
MGISVWTRSRDVIKPLSPYEDAKKPDIDLKMDLSFLDKHIEPDRLADRIGSQLEDFLAIFWRTMRERKRDRTADISAAERIPLAAAQRVFHSG